MKQVDQTIISRRKHPGIFDHLGKNAALANNLYNASLFRIRQVFTGWDKPARTANEQQVFDELERAKAAYPGKKFGRVLSPLPHWISCCEPTITRITLRGSRCRPRKRSQNRRYRTSGTG